MHHSDRSRYECGGKCPRKRFWNYHYTLDTNSRVRGVVPVGDAEALLFGSAIHHFLEDSFRGMKRPNKHLQKLMELVSGDLTPDGLEVADEYSSLFLGLTSTFALFNLPGLLKEYNFVDAEREYGFTLGDSEWAKWLGRFDIILQRKEDGKFFNMEAKTTSWLDQLIKQQPMNFQLLMEQYGMQQHYHLREEEVGGSILLAFNKGQRKRATKWEQDHDQDGYRRLSPFTYLYQKEYGKPVGKVGQTPEAKYGDGWQRLAAWTVPGWAEKLANEFIQTVREQVQVLPSVSFDSQQLVSVLMQVEAVEANMAHGDSDYASLQNLGYQEKGRLLAMDSWWPQTFTNCYNDGGFGKPCPYLALCQSPTMAKNPVATGEYEWRVANHPTEEEG